MKHATSAALDAIPELLAQIRQRDGIRERKPGIFYRKSKAFLHFHEDPKGIFADLTVGNGFIRYPVNGAEEWHGLLAAIDRQLAPTPSAPEEGNA